MQDLEKVVKGLDCCAKWMYEFDFDACNNCPYGPGFSYADHGCIGKLNHDSIALLREQQKLIDDMMLQQSC